ARAGRAAARVREVTVPVIPGRATREPGISLHDLQIPGSRCARPGMTATKQRPLTMRFMMLMIPLGYETAPPDVQLDPERVKTMMKYNEALQEAGVLIALDGL